MANDFLHKEYDQCFQQLRFYDERQFHLLTYLCTLTSAVASAIFVLYQLLAKESYAFYAALMVLGLIVFVACVLLFLAMLQNRLYFVFTARQINAIRSHCLKHESPEFTDNQMYTSTNFPAAKPLSVHTMGLVGTAVLVSLYASAVAFGASQLMTGTGNVAIAVGALVATLLVCSFGGFDYLKSQSEKAADRAIHLDKGGKS